MNLRFRLAFPFPKHKMSTFPIWDSTCTFISRQEDGAEWWMDESEVRYNIGRQRIGVLRTPGSSRSEMKLYWKVREKATEKKGLRRIQTGQPNVVRETVGDVYHVYMHHAERCQAHYDGRQMPVVKYDHYARQGSPHARGSHKIDASCL